MGYKLFETLYDCKYVYSIMALDYSLAGYRILVRKLFSFRILKLFSNFLLGFTIIIEKSETILIPDLLHALFFFFSFLEGCRALKKFFF